MTVTCEVEDYGIDQGILRLPPDSLTVEELNDYMGELIDAIAFNVKRIPAGDL